MTMTKTKTKTMTQKLNPQTLAITGGCLRIVRYFIKMFLAEV